MNRYEKSRKKNIQTLKDKGLEILSDWTGQRVINAKNTPVQVTVRQTKCGHIFTSSAVNLLSRGIECATCGKMERTSYINHWSERNSDRWRQTASEWKKYRAAVTKHTRITYLANKNIINPHNLPTGRCGTEGAYQLDHIISVRYGFDNGIPPEEIAAVTNLQMLPWLENLVKKDRIIDNNRTDDYLLSTEQSGMAEHE